MFAGTEFTIGGEKFVVPTLSLGQLRQGLIEKLRLHDELVAAGKAIEALDIRGQVILAAIRRNYPDFAEAKIWENLDMANVHEIWLAVLGMSGLQQGEAAAAPKSETNGT